MPLFEQRLFLCDGERYEDSRAIDGHTPRDLFARVGERLQRAVFGIMAQREPRLRSGQRREGFNDPRKGGYRRSQGDFGERRATLPQPSPLNRSEEV